MFFLNYLQYSEEYEVCEVEQNILCSPENFSELNMYREKICKNPYNVRLES